MGDLVKNLNPINAITDGISAIAKGDIGGILSNPFVTAGLNSIAPGAGNIAATASQWFG